MNQLDLFGERLAGPFEAGRAAGLAGIEKHGPAYRAARLAACPDLIGWTQTAEFERGWCRGWCRFANLPFFPNE